MMQKLQEVVHFPPASPAGGRSGTAEQDDRVGRISRRAVLLLGTVASTLAVCTALAALTADDAGVVEEASMPEGSRRLGTASEAGCRTAMIGEPCYRHVMWAKYTGIHQSPELYPGLSSDSSFEAFQTVLHADVYAQCSRPCAASAPPHLAASLAASTLAASTFAAAPPVGSDPSVAATSAGDSGHEKLRNCSNDSNDSNGTNCTDETDEHSEEPGEHEPGNGRPEEPGKHEPAIPPGRVPPPVPATPTMIGWQPSDRMVAQGQWCGVNVPNPGWKIDGCGKGSGINLKVLTYNLFWWNLFGRRYGNGGSAGHLIGSTGRENPYDVMGFQECENIEWVLADAGLTGEYGGLTGPHALCLAYKRSWWELLSQGAVNVGEDRYDQWYGTRAAMWVRLRHWQTGQTVFFINHHGPLPVDSGGLCGGEATAYNLLKVIATQAVRGDVVTLVGDFNAGPWTPTVRSLEEHLYKVYTGNSFGGVDNILSSCSAVIDRRNLGGGGSDHDALQVVFQL